jgi:hypothetical protein
MQPPCFYTSPALITAAATLHPMRRHCCSVLQLLGMTVTPTATISAAKAPAATAATAAAAPASVSAQRAAPHAFALRCPGLLLPLLLLLLPVLQLLPYYAYVTALHCAVLAATSKALLCRKSVGAPAFRKTLDASGVTKKKRFIMPYASTGVQHFAHVQL